MPTVTLPGSTISYAFTTAGTYTVTATVTDGTLTATSSPLTITLTSAATGLGIQGTWSRTGIYSMAAAWLGLESFDQISEFDTGNKDIFDNQWTNFFSIFIDKWRLEDFEREEAVTSAIDTTQFDSVENVEGFDTFVNAPTDLVRPIEVNGTEWVMGAERGRWQWGNLSYTLNSNKLVRRVIFTTENVSTSNPMQLKFLFLPRTPSDHDQPFDHFIQPSTCQFMAIEFALQVANQIPIPPEKFEQLRQLSREFQSRTQVLEAHTGSRRLRSSGDIVRSRRGRGRGRFA